MPTYRTAIGGNAVQIFHAGNRSSSTGGFQNTIGVGCGMQQRHVNIPAYLVPRITRIITPGTEEAPEAPSGKPVSVLTSYHYVIDGVFMGVPVDGRVTPEVAAAIARGDRRFMQPR